MLANSPKDNQLPSAETCALYYFPEIPNSREKCRGTASSPGGFVRGALEPNDARGPLGAEPQDQEQIQQLVDASFEKGVAQGRAETMAAQREQIEKAAAALEAAVKEMIRIRQQDMDRMETETVRLALAIAKKVIGHEAEHGQTIGHVLKAAMEKVGDPRHLTLRLNPEDIDTVNGLKQELLLADEVGAVMHLEADDAIQRGGCIIETKLGDVDARLDQQIKIIEAQLKDHLPKPVVKR